MDEMDDEAAAIGAVNVIQFLSGKLKGYNSDVYGFEFSLRKPILEFRDDRTKYSRRL